MEEIPNLLADYITRCRFLNFSDEQILRQMQDKNYLVSDINQAFLKANSIKINLKEPPQKEGLSNYKKFLIFLLVAIVCGYLTYLFIW